MDSCGRPEGDSFDQAFVVHHVWVGVSVELFSSLTPITSSQSFRGSERYCCSEVSEFSKTESWLSSHLGKTLENPSLPTKTLLPWTTLFFSSSLHVPRGNRYLGILRVKAIAIFVHLWIYLFVLTNTNKLLVPLPGNGSYSRIKPSDLCIFVFLLPPPHSPHHNHHRPPLPHGFHSYL